MEKGFEFLTEMTFDERAFSVNASYSWGKVYKVAGGYKANFYMNKKALDFKKEIRFQAKKKYREDPVKENLYVCVDFLYKHNYGRDIDNGLKLLFDALQGVVYEDDNQIIEMKVSKRECRVENKIKVTIFRELELKLL